ncbi:MAG TPA: hypothetical protein EYP85_01560 [Armatimonadetes bacterium]|nr:hypothetical protein [Armatimonadota bacterium]
MLWRRGARKIDLPPDLPDLGRYPEDEGKYPEKYLALVGNRIIAVGSTMPEVHRQVAKWEDTLPIWYAGTLDPAQNYLWQRAQNGVPSSESD